MTVHTIVLSVGSILGSCVLSYVLLGPLSLIPIGVVAVHELGHLFGAISTGAVATKWPILVPLGPIVLGMTYVENPTKPSLVAWAGPLAGMIAAAVFALCSFGFGLPIAFGWLSTFMFLAELVAFYFSSDAKKAFAPFGA
jgi:uncharacterized protein (DUF697 family)